MNWAVIAIAVGKAVGTVVLSMLTTLLTGKTFRYILLLPFEKWAKWTKNPTDDKIVEEAKKDLGIDDK